MAWRLYSAKPLSEPMLPYSQLDPKNKIHKFSFKEIHLKMSAKWQPFCLCLSVLTLKHRKTHGCVFSTVATDALVLKHQAISIHNAD